MNITQAIKEIQDQELYLLQEARFGGEAARKVIDSYDRYRRNSKACERELIATWKLYKEGRL